MRKTIVSVLLAGTLAAGGAVALTSTNSGAATTSSSSATASTKATATHHHAHLRRALRRAVVRISAKTIGIKPADLVSELRSGKSIADVANEHNVAPQKVIDALVTAGHNRVEKAVAAHKITRARGNKIEARLPKLAARIVNHVFNPRSPGGSRP